MMFTGSTATGRRTASDAGKRLIGASLELGGENAMTVLDDADIEKATEGAVNARFPSAGQLCVSVERLYVAESIRDAFVAAFVARTKRLRIGAAYDYGVDAGSLTTPSQLETVTGHVADAVSKGATVLATVLAAGTAPRASSSTPRRRPSPTSAARASVRPPPSAPRPGPAF